MKFITSEHLINEINENFEEKVLDSKYELTMLVATRAKQIAEEVAAEENKNPEETKIVKPISVSVQELEENKLEISRAN